MLLLLLLLHLMLVLLVLLLQLLLLVMLLLLLLLLLLKLMLKLIPLQLLVVLVVQRHIRLLLTLVAAHSRCRLPGMSRPGRICSTTITTTTNSPIPSAWVPLCLALLLTCCTITPSTGNNGGRLPSMSDARCTFPSPLQTRHGLQPWRFPPHTRQALPIPCHPHPPGAPHPMVRC